MKDFSKKKKDYKIFCVKQMLVILDQSIIGKMRL